MIGIFASFASLATWIRLPGSGLVVTMPSALAAIAERTASCCEATSPLWNDVLTVFPVSLAHWFAPARKYVQTGSAGEPCEIQKNVFACAVNGIESASSAPQ